MFIMALFTIAKTWKQHKCPSMIHWKRKMWHIYTMEYYTAIKNNEFLSFVGTWLNLEAIILSKLTQEPKIKIFMQPTDMKKSSSSLVIRVTQIKIMLRYHFMPFKLEW